MIKRTKQFTVWLPNKLGVAAKFLSVLGKTNLLAISVLDSVDGCAVRVVPSNTAAALRMLNKAKICSSTQDVLVVDVPNLPGALLKISRKLARAKVNIEYMYGSAGTRKSEAPLVLRVSSVAKAVRALK